MIYLLYAYSKSGGYQDCGPVQPEYTTLTTLRHLAQQNVERLNATADNDLWGVDVTRYGKTIARAGWKRDYPLLID